MPVRVICPNLRCRKLLTVPEDARSKVVSCPFCRSPFRVPQGQVAPKAAPAPSAQ